MQKSEILYEPLPIARIGVRRDDEAMVIATDFSCFGFMLDEYISFGAINIVMPKSAPEISNIDKMPPLLKKRIKIIDDENEIETVMRLLFNLRKEFSVKISDENQHLTFPKNTPKKLTQSIKKAHSDIKRLTLGFNHGVQIEINPQISIENFKYLREQSYDKQARAILAQLESFIKLYNEVEFNAPSSPKSNHSTELISEFDHLVNDQSYLKYSDLMARLTSPYSQKQALLDIREFSRKVTSESFSKGWNFLTKIINICCEKSIPEFSEISAIIQGRSLPALINFQEARHNAIETWKKSYETVYPLQRNGHPIGEDEVYWLPPFNSMSVYSPDNEHHSLGTVKELLDALTKLKDNPQIIKPEL